jgi:hypothetical protein
MEMNALAIFLLVVPLADTIPAPEVRGLVATRVKFEGVARAKVAGAVLDLLATCAHSQSATEEQWVDAQQKCHLHIKFVKPPRVVDVYGAAKIEVTEIVVTFPLLSTGGIWVRSGDRYAYFAKYRGPADGKIQELLREAKPVE